MGDGAARHGRHADAADPRLAGHWRHRSVQREGGGRSSPGRERSCWERGPQHIFSKDARQCNSHSLRLIDASATQAAHVRECEIGIIVNVIDMTI